MQHGHIRHHAPLSVRQQDGRMLGDFLNQSSRVTRKIRVSAGGYAMCPVDVRVILKEAILCEAVALIICHNHPSGSHMPSSEDDKLTTALRSASNALNINMIDHVIIVNDTYYSYADEGRI